MRTSAKKIYRTHPRKVFLSMEGDFHAIVRRIRQMIADIEETQLAIVGIISRGIREE
jgi:hypothetical protein